MASRLQFRRDTAAGWVSTNPVLTSGEPGVETDTHRIKIGDGATVWNSLPYAAIDTTTYVTTYQLAIGPMAPVNPVLGQVWIQTLT